MKKIIILLLFILFGALYALKDSSFFWLPSSIRTVLISTQFKEGECVSAPKYWGVSPKRVIGFKFKKRKTFYLLRDLDKYEHDQLIQEEVVEKIARKVSCP